MKMLKSFQALKEEDHRRALYASLIFIMLLILFFLLVSLEEPDPPLVDPPVEIEMPDIEIEFGSQPEGGSQSSESNPEPVENMVENPETPTSEVDTQEESPVSVPTSNGDTDSDNTEEETPQVDNTFTFGSGNGSGQGNGSGDDFGSGTGVGGNGVGNTPGDGTYNPNRKVTKDPTFNKNVQEEGKIALDIWVDSKGNVVKTRIRESKSTSGSSYLISLAEKAARTMKYDAKPGAGWEHVGYKVFSFTKI
ncbi:MAG: hypothetical protein MK078_05935 [Crocinitomicaceae bacterium]|nr:hypothetical protein [Crocinitomicaceae bacterium]